jgi:hypothetical protein
VPAGIFSIKIPLISSMQLSVPLVIPRLESCRSFRSSCRRDRHACYQHHRSGKVLKKHRESLLADWSRDLAGALSRQKDLIRDSELRVSARLPGPIDPGDPVGEVANTPWARTGPASGIS